MSERLTRLSLKEVQEILSEWRNDNSMPGFFRWLEELGRKDEEIIDVLVQPIPNNSKIFNASLIFADGATAQKQISKEELEKQ